MKGKFKGKLLSFLRRPVISGVIKGIPGVGHLASNILDNINGSEPGAIDKRTIRPIIIQIVIILALGYAASQGWLTAEEVEVIKGNI